MVIVLEVFAVETDVFDGCQQTFSYLFCWFQNQN